MVDSSDDKFEEVRARLQAADIVFGGALGAFFGLAVARESLTDGGYANFSMMLIVVGLGARAISQLGPSISAKRHRRFINALIKSVISMAIAATLASAASVDWKAVLFIMSSWILFVILSAVIDDVRHKLNGLEL